MRGREIANQQKVSPAFVSKTLKEAKRRIKELLEDVARMNKITLEIVSEEQGFARGHSHIFNISGYITFSPQNGVNVWYEHKGECTSCDEYNHCREVLIQEFKERKIPIQNPTLRPTDLGEILFKHLEEKLSDNS